MDNRVRRLSFSELLCQVSLTRNRYRVNGKAHTQEAKQSPFAFAQQQPGEFKITSIAQQQKMCKSVVTDLSYTVHPLPAAQVGQGNRIFQDIHEGKAAPCPQVCREVF